MVFEDLFKGSPVILAPMEDVSDAVFRKLCRVHGANLCVTEFVNAEGLLRGCRTAAKKIRPPHPPVGHPLAPPALLPRRAAGESGCVPSGFDAVAGRFEPDEAHARVVGASSM